ncbi:MAG: diaminopimelate epimerase [Elusimicrobiota bacterium]
MKKIPFIKMHGAGNDFVFISREESKIPITSKLATLLLDRHFGIGGDQLLLLNPGKNLLNHNLTIFNSDGSQAEMCGNGVRAVAYYLLGQKKIKNGSIIHTKGGPKVIGIKGSKIDVDMGEPILEGKKIPVKASGEIKNYLLKLPPHPSLSPKREGQVRVHCVSMGNPHCVVFVHNVDQFPVKELGPRIETHPFFPNRVNVEFVQVINSREIKARVWERGAGETLACGTGACAIGVASARAGKTARDVKIHLPGGVLFVRWDNNNHVFLSGPAQTTYSGQFLI